MSVIGLLGVAGIEDRDDRDFRAQIFLRHGFDGTSISDLTRAMGIQRPSLYAAFGDKEKLFQHAVDHYLRRFGDGLDDAGFRARFSGSPVKRLRATDTTPWIRSCRWPSESPVSGESARRAS